MYASDGVSFGKYMSAGLGVILDMTVYDGGLNMEKVLEKLKMPWKTMDTECMWY